MDGFIFNMEQATTQNDNYRQVLHTAYFCQLVVMSLLPGEEIGMEVRDFDQFIRFESGYGKVIMDGKEHNVVRAWAVLIPTGVEHNVINISHSKRLKLSFIYTPPEHLPGTVHATKADETAHLPSSRSVVSAT
jgi:mannose-6-phosphate isomerase-like protein (cupin superfamily)